MNNSNQLSTTNQNSKLVLAKSKVLVDIANKILAKKQTVDIVDESWIEKLWEWADKHKEYQIPRSKQELLSVTHIYLSLENANSIPDEFFNLKTLEELYLGSPYSENNLEFIPDTIKKLKNLRNLNLRRTKISKFPISLTELKNLTVLRLHSNITDIESLANFKYLRVLELRGSIKCLPEDIIELNKLAVIKYPNNLQLTKSQQYFIDNILESNIPHQHYNQEEVYMDENLNLCWKLDTAILGVEYEETLSIIKKLNNEKYFGYDDWQLPSALEIVTLFKQNDMKKLFKSNLDYSKCSCWVSTSVSDSCCDGYGCANSYNYFKSLSSDYDYHKRSLILSRRYISNENSHENILIKWAVLHGIRKYDFENNCSRRNDFKDNFVLNTGFPKSKIFFKEINKLSINQIYSSKKITSLPNEIMNLFENLTELDLSHCEKLNINSEQINWLKQLNKKGCIIKLPQNLGNVL